MRTRKSTNRYTYSPYIEEKNRFERSLKRALKKSIETYNEEKPETGINAFQIMNSESLADTADTTGTADIISRSKRPRTDSVHLIINTEEELEAIVKERKAAQRTVEKLLKREKIARKKLRDVGGVEFDSLLKLSFDPLCIILSFLHSKEISVIAQVCSRLNSIVDMSDTWAKRDQEIGLSTNQLGKSEARDTRKRVLRFESANCFAIKLESDPIFYNRCNLEVTNDVFRKDLRDYELFMRMFSGKDNLIFQGFLPKQNIKREGADGYDQIRIFTRKMCLIPDHHNESYSVVILFLNIQLATFNPLYASFGKRLSGISFFFPSTSRINRPKIEFHAKFSKDLKFFQQFILRWHFE